MADLLNPQFSLPFRLSGSGVEEVEQDTADEVYQNVLTVLRYRLGDRDALPTFGIPDPVFQEGGIDLRRLTRAVQQWEPDATLDMIRDAVTSEGLDEIKITVSQEETDNG